MVWRELGFGSIEPLIITDEFIFRALKLEKLCYHFHLSLQSGSNDTLKRMNRRYSIEKFEEIVNKIRTNFENCILTTDIIVGFPGEDKKEFDETFEFLKKIKFYKMHVFKYSVREGTKAAVMEKQVEPEEKEKRSNVLLKLSDDNEKEYLKSYIGKTVKVLFEEKQEKFWKGHTSNYLMVNVKSNVDLTNMMCDVKILEQKDLELIGEINL